MEHLTSSLSGHSEGKEEMKDLGVRCLMRVGGKSSWMSGHFSDRRGGWCERALEDESVAGLVLLAILLFHALTNH